MKGRLQLITRKIKAILAMALAGVMAASVIPVTASATVNGFKYEGQYSTKAADIINDLGDISDSSAWDVIYDGSHHGVTGEKLEETLVALENDPTDHGDVELTAGFVYYARDNSSDPSAAFRAAVTANQNRTLYTLPVNASSLAYGASLKDVLHELSGWRLWVGDSGFNTISPVAPVSTAEEIGTSDIVDAINALGTGYENIAIQFIFKGTEFNVPYYSVFNEPLGGSYTISADDHGTLEGKYGFYHRVPDVAESFLIVSSGDEAWDFIERMVRNFNDFYYDRSKLIRYAVIEVFDSNGTSVGSFDPEDSSYYQYLSPYKYFKSRENSNVLWLVRDKNGTYPAFSASGDKVEDKIDEFLAQNIYVDGINVRLCPELKVTSDTLSDGDVITDAGLYQQYNLTELPAKISDISGALTLQEHKGFDYDNWKLFEAVPTGTQGEYTLSELSHDKDGFSLDSISGIANGSMLVAYIPQIDLNTIPLVEADVIEPEEGEKPINIAFIPAGTNYGFSSVTWYSNGQPFSGEFAAGGQYTVAIKMKAEKYYEFDKTTSAEINGNEAVIRDLTSDTIIIEYTFKLPEDPWSFVDAELAKENPVINVPDGLSIPARVMQKIKNSGKAVELNYGGYSWIITGFDADYTANDIDLRVTVVAENNWAEAVKNASGHLYKMQISIQHGGKFGFTAYLKLDLSQGRPSASGRYYAGLYEISGSALNLSGSSGLTTENGKWIAKFKFTHASDWLVTVDGKKNTGNSGGTIEEKKASTLKSEGWADITEEIKSADIGSVIEITLNDEPTMPGEALRAATERKIRLIIDAGYGRVWTIDGANAVAGGDIDLGISGVDVGIPESASADITCTDRRLLTINARALGFTARLTVPTGDNGAGQKAALYRFDENTGRLVFQEISEVGGDGNATFDITGGGRYFIAIGGVEVPAYICGDADGNGAVNAMDAVAVLKYVAFGDSIDLRSGDADSNGVVNAYDAMLILQYATGKVKALPAER